MTSDRAASAKPAAKPSVRPAASPDALLREAVSGARAPAAAVQAAPAPKSRRGDARTMGAAGAALALGILVGAGTAMLAVPRADAGIALAALDAGLEAARAETARLGAEVARLGKALTGLRETEDAARDEARSARAAAGDRLARTEQVVMAKLATLGERLEQGEREHAARIAALATQIEKKPQAPGPAPSSAGKPEPVQTGSLPEMKAKPTVIEGWAVRDVYDGTAMLEDRRRRLVEVGAGGSIPGVGRVEAVERRGREWVVVTRQGIVTPQPW